MPKFQVVSEYQPSGDQPEAIAALAGQYPGRMLFSPGDAPALTLKLRRSDDPLRTAAQAVERYAALLAPKS